MQKQSRKPNGSPSMAERIEASRPFALRWALHIIKNRADAEDAVGEACLRALRSSHTYDPKKSFDRWFKHIVTMICYEWIRAAKAQKRPQTVSFSQLVPHPDGSGEGFHPAIDAPDPNADVAREVARRVSASSVGIVSGEGVADVGDFPEWLLGGLLSVPEPDRDLLLDVYVLQKRRQDVARALGVNEYRFNQRLLAAQNALRRACGIAVAAVGKVAA